MTNPRAELSPRCCRRAIGEWMRFVRATTWNFPVRGSAGADTTSTRTGWIGSSRSGNTSAVRTALALFLFTALPVMAADRVVVVTVTEGFRHDSIETAEVVIADIGQRRLGFDVTFARNE